MAYLFLPLLGPLVLAAAAYLATRQNEKYARHVSTVAEAAAFGSFLISVLAASVLVLNGSGTSAMIGFFGIGLSVRLDAVSAIMLVMVSFVGWVVLRYSRTFMDSEDGHLAFTRWMATTLAAVLLLVMSGNVIQLFAAWILTSLSLNQLLVFYPERATARRAARKKAIVARMSEATLASSLALLVMGSGTTDIMSILATAEPTWVFLSAALLLAIAAALASAQFPLHGWLTEVMEAPTPVSALLHAGVINAGGFLLIRFADVMIVAPGVLALLVLLGGFTALFGGLVMLTQPAVKTSLAWSTIAQMGFMVMQCGLALFPLALLHIVAHSLYKAHAFLSAGEAVRNVAAIRRPGPVAVPSARKVLQSFVIAIVIYGLVGTTIGFDGKSVQAICLGVILIFGVAYLLAQGFADTAPRALMQRTVVYALVTSVSYFVLQVIAQKLTAGALPFAPAPGPLEWALIILALASFGCVAVAQATFPLWASHPAAAGLRVHLTNGLYANAVFDRLLGGWSRRSIA